MGERQVCQDALFYEFSLDRHVPADHMLRAIDRYVELGELRLLLAPFYSSTGRPSIDPELLIRMLLVGYCFGIRSERRLCEEVHLNLAYRWFCQLGLEADVPDHSTFSKNRHGRFRDSDLMRHLFETVLHRCMEEGLVGGEGFAVDASLIKADANRQKGVEGSKGLAPEMTGRAIDEYLAVLDDAAFGAASEVTPKFLSPADPAARWTGAHGGQAFFAYSTNYLIDLDNAIIVDVEASTAIRQAEVSAAKTMIDRVDDTSSGSGLIQLLNSGTRFNVIGKHPSDNKETRLLRQQGAFEAASILFPEEAPGLAEFEAELLAFPAGRYDDQVDAILLMLEWFGGQSVEIPDIRLTFLPRGRNALDRFSIENQ